MTHENYTNFLAIPENENMMAQSNSATVTLVEETKKHRALYPEIHYKLQPFISVTCDAIHASGAVPTPKDLDDITDNIYDEFCRIHPEMENYMKTENREDDQQEAVPTIAFGGGFGHGFGRGFGGFRRRGIGRDLIGALLLSELARRRHPFFPQPFFPFI